MPDVGLVGSNGSLTTIIVSNEFPFDGGPYPGTVNFLFVMNFFGFVYVAPPNVLAATSSPHWTAHPIWATTTAAGFVVNRKTEAYAGTQFKAYALAIGYRAGKKLRKDEQIRAEISVASEEEFERLSQGQFTKGLLSAR
jgi:hypothetical protein